MNAIKKVLSGDKEHSSTGTTMSSSSVPSETANRIPTSAAGATTGDGSRSSATHPTGDLAGAPHHTGDAATTGHSSSGIASRLEHEFDPKTATHSHTHLAHKTKETHHHHETEEVERLKDHERHVTHVQHHVQPVKDTEHKEEVHHQRSIPQTHIEERHVSTDADRAAFAGLATHQDSVHQGTKERKVVDLGEKVQETVHHHVHNVIQPVIHKDTHEHHKIHTVVPTHHVTHEAPIVHQSVEHGMLDKASFLKQGGVLGSNITHDKADVLASGTHERKVDGVGEDLARKLHLGGTHSGVDTTPTTTGNATAI